MIRFGTGFVVVVAILALTDVGSVVNFLRVMARRSIFELVVFSLETSDHG